MDGAKFNILSDYQTFFNIYHYFFDLQILLLFYVQIFNINSFINHQIKMQKEEKDIQQVQEDKQQSDFSAYPSIENHTQKKFVNRIIKSKLTDPDILWCALQKIHGANFSVYCNGKFAKYGRRKDYISKEIPILQKQIEPYFLQNFLDAHKLVINFHNKLGELFDLLKEKYSQMEYYILYGEYFGGYWTGDNVQKKIVQRGVFYTPNHQYLVFDVKIGVKDNKDLWMNVNDLDKYVGKYIKCVPIYKCATFDEIIHIPSQFDSTIPQFLGLQRIKNNICEGFVIRPNQNIYLNYKRVIIKKKNKQFLQIVNQPAAKVVQDIKKVKVKKIYDKEIEQILQKLKDYLNQNRINSARSKMPDANFQQLKLEIFNDIIEDSKKNEIQIPQNLAKKIKQILYMNINDLLNEFVEKYGQFYDIKK